MDKNSAIFTRRSVRAYDNTRRASREQILDILDAAMHAPTAMGKEPWEFIVADDEKAVADIMKIHPYCESLKDAGTAIIVCGDLDAQFKIPEGGYYQYDCSAATQNLLLRAKELGLDTCWCGIAPEKTRIAGFKKYFDLPENIEPMALVILGYGAETPAPDPQRFKKQKIHFNKW